MDALSSVLIAKALDGLSMRYLATAENIANASTPGYRPVRVSFEQSLLSAARRGVAAVGDVSPRLEAPGPEGAGTLRLDLEVATASETALRYTALLDVLGRQMQLSRAVIGSGGQ